MRSIVRVGLSLLTVIIVGCGGGGGGDTTNTGGTAPAALPTVGFAAASLSVAENLPGSVTVSLSASSTAAVTVPFSLTGTASGSGTDYTISASPVTIPAGSLSATLTVTPVDDLDDEPDETVIITIGTPTNATLGSTSVSTVTIVDNDLPLNAGFASYTKLTVVPPVATSPLQYSLQIDLAPFDAVTYETASISGLKTVGTNLRVPGGSQILGEQKYTLQSVNCASSSASNQYAALMLFDRSGSMSSSDPQDDTLVAAREFVNRMDSAGQAWVAAFPGGSASRPTSPATFYGTGFTTDKTQLLANIAAVGPPSGNTPLWDSMDASVNKFGTVSSSGPIRALLTFSDGENNEGTTTSQAVLSNATARQVKVFAINLRNSASQTLDSIALATGGAVYSTDDAKKLVAFYGTLGKLLSGQSQTCSATIGIQFVPQNGVGDVAYGPGSTVKTELEFNAKSASADVLAETTISFPFYPGRKIGQTNSGKSVYETDIGSATGLSCLTQQAGPALRNDCTRPIWADVCNVASPSSCRRGVVNPGASIAAYPSYKYAQCPWFEPVEKFESVEASGSAPSQVFTLFTANSTGYVCVNTVRGPF